MFPDWNVPASLTNDRERDIYDAGFLIGYLTREPEIERAEHDANRYYALAYDRRRLCTHCSNRTS